MGTSLASIQVYIGNTTSSEEIRLSIIDALKKYVLKGNFEETTRDPDRIIFVGPVASHTPWLTVLDTQGNLRELAKLLSEVTDGTTVFVNLIDSDVIHLRRYKQGSVVNDYCNEPEIYDSYTSNQNWLADWNEANKDQLQTLKDGDISKWEDLFVEGTNVTTLQNIWHSNPVLADDILWATVKALGMNEQEIWTAGQDETFTKLSFRLKEPRQYEIKAEGAPKLDLHGYGILTDIYRGDDLDVFISIRNDGGESTGLNILAWGTALDKKIIDLQQVKVHKGTNRDDALEAKLVLQNASLENQDLPIHAVSLPDFEIPAGVAGGLSAQNQPGVDWQKAFNALNQTLFHVRLLGKVETEGQGDLFVAFVPHQNQHDGHVAYQASVSARPTPRRPLRYKNARRPVPSAHLQDLETPSHFFVLMAFDTECQESANIAGEIIEDWAKRKIQTPKDLFVTRLRKQVYLLSNEKKLSAQQILKGAQWKKIRQALETCVSFSIDHNSTSVIYDADPIFFQSGNELLSPHLVFFFPAENIEVGELVRWEEWSTKIVNDLMERKLIIQAFMGRWNWRGQQINMTPYEIATGLGGQCTTAQFWFKRFLRGVTRQIWLGPELISHLGGIDHLVSIAEVKKLGNGAYIHLNDEATLDELEIALELLLPSEKDWLEGMNRIYSGRKTQDKDTYGIESE